MQLSDKQVGLLLSATGRSAAGFQVIMNHSTDPKIIDVCKRCRRAVNELMSSLLDMPVDLLDEMTSSKENCEVSIAAILSLEDHVNK